MSYLLFRIIKEIMKYESIYIIGYFTERYFVVIFNYYRYYLHDRHTQMLFRYAKKWIYPRPHQSY